LFHPVPKENLTPGCRAGRPDSGDQLARIG
jgi:hypothetical protein